MIAAIAVAIGGLALAVGGVLGFCRKSVCRKSVCRGWAGKFGHKAQVVDNVDGIVLDHSVEQGNPPDAPQLAPAVERVKKRTGRAPGKARRAAEHRQAFRRTVKWRTGSAGRISYLKRGYGWDRTRIDGTEGTRIWAGHGIWAHNLVKISALAAWSIQNHCQAPPAHRLHPNTISAVPTFSGRSN